MTYSIVSNGEWRGAGSNRRGAPRAENADTPGAGAENADTPGAGWLEVRAEGADVTAVGSAGSG